MRYQSVCVMYYPAWQNKEEIEIALLRGEYTDLPDGVKLSAMMTREELLARFTAARWEVIEPDNGEMIVFARLVYGDYVAWPSKWLKGERAITKPTVTHYLGVPGKQRGPITVMKRNYHTDRTWLSLEVPPQDAEPFAVLEHLYPHERVFAVWHSERVEIDEEHMTIIDYGWYEWFISYVWTTSQTPPDDR